MNISQANKQYANINLSLEELIIINNAINEVCHGFEVSEFDTRIGASLESAQALLEQIGFAIKQVEQE